MLKMINRWNQERANNRKKNTIEDIAIVERAQIIQMLKIARSMGNSKEIVRLKLVARMNNIKLR